MIGVSRRGIGWCHPAAGIAEETIVIGRKVPVFDALLRSTTGLLIHIFPATGVAGGGAGGTRRIVHGIVLHHILSGTLIGILITPYFEGLMGITQWCGRGTGSGMTLTFVFRKASGEGDGCFGPGLRWNGRFWRRGVIAATTRHNGESCQCRQQQDTGKPQQASHPQGNMSKCHIHHSFVHNL